MHLYIHEMDKTSNIELKDIKDELFEKALKDYHKRIRKRYKELKIETTKHGKKYFPNAKKIHFSISHSGRFWSCIFDKKNVGLDIEDYATRNMPPERFKDITERFYKPDEKEFVIGNYDENASDNDGGEALKSRFFKIWTSKEAYMKYTGNGFTEGFKNFSVLDDSLGLFFQNITIDSKSVLTICSERNKELEERIDI